MTSMIDDDQLDLSPFRVRSRREIVNLLRAVSQRRQLVRLQTKDGSDSAVTSILDVDDANDMVIIDCAPNALTNRRIVDSDEISFETVLENIRILFFVPHAENCDYDERPALRVPVPEIMIRLQRRDSYRVTVPLSDQVKCHIPIPDETGKIASTVSLPLYNVSAGGIAVIDDKMQIDPPLYAIYENCRIDLPGGAVVTTLQFQNSHEVSLASRKEIRRLGFRFVDFSNAGVAAIQRYITKLEREQNARKTGMSS
ncbi:flagellar brake protein [Herbaspirillum sp. GCM10030257]|uniref:flagellar brake protein n=1 Tax=Herbaspirillum sp. GCM10030257 TaxID=3273393 RepID=UPI0036151474